MLLRIARLFEAQSRDLQPLAVVSLVQLGEKWRFVAAVRAPAPGDRHDQRFAAKIRVCIHSAIQIGKPEVEWFIRILRLRISPRIERRLPTTRPRSRRPQSRQL